MAAMNSIRSHLGDWISVHAYAERRPPRLTVTFTFGELPQGWARPHGRARTWVGLLGLACIAPFVVLLAAASLRGVGLTAPYDSISGSSFAILAATLSLFVGIPVALAVNLWRITRLGVQRNGVALEGLVALEFAPLHLIVVMIALVVAALFVGHLAVDSYACLNGLHSAC
jgi:hypothetical protein